MSSHDQHIHHHHPSNRAYYTLAVAGAGAVVPAETVLSTHPFPPSTDPHVPSPHVVVPSPISAPSPIVVPFPIVVPLQDEDPSPYDHACTALRRHSIPVHHGHSTFLRRGTGGNVDGQAGLGSRGFEYRGKSAGAGKEDVGARDCCAYIRGYSWGRRLCWGEGAFWCCRGRRGFDSREVVVGWIRGFGRGGELFVEGRGCIVVEGYFENERRLGNSDRRAKRMVALGVDRRIVGMIVVPFLLFGSNLLVIVIETFHLRCWDFEFCDRPCRVGDSMSRSEEGG